MSSDLGGLAQEAIKLAVESVLGKIKEGKKLSTEDIFLLYLATISRELGEIRKEVAETNQRIDVTSTELSRRIDETSRRIDAIIQELGRRIDEINKRIDTMFEELGKRIDEANKRMDTIVQELGRRIDETNKRIDGIYALLLGVQKLLAEIAKTSSGSAQ